MVKFQDNEWTEGYHPDVCYGQHDGQRQLEHGVLVEGAEVGQREEADGGDQVDLRQDQTQDTEKKSSQA